MIVSLLFVLIPAIYSQQNPIVSDVQDLVWSSISTYPVLFPARGFAASATMTITTVEASEDVIIIFGGLTHLATTPLNGSISDTIFSSNSTYSYELWIFSARLLSWINVSDLQSIQPGYHTNGPCARAAHTLSSGNSQKMLLLFGGRNGSACFNDLWKIEISSDLIPAYTELQSVGERPAPRWGHSAVVFHNYLVVFGGFADVDMITVADEHMWMFSLESNIESNNWIKILPVSSTTLCLAFAHLLPYNSTTLVLGGGSVSSQSTPSTETYFVSFEFDNSSTPISISLIFGGLLPQGLAAGAALSVSISQAYQMPIIIWGSSVPLCHPFSLIEYPVMSSDSYYFLDGTWSLVNNTKIDTQIAPAFVGSTVNCILDILFLFGGYNSFESVLSDVPLAASLMFTFMGSKLCVLSIIVYPTHPSFSNILTLTHDLLYLPVVLYI